MIKAVLKSSETEQEELVISEYLLEPLQQQIAEAYKDLNILQIHKTLFGIIDLIRGLCISSTGRFLFKGFGFQYMIDSSQQVHKEFYEIYNLIRQEGYGFRVTEESLAVFQQHKFKILKTSDGLDFCDTSEDSETVYANNLAFFINTHSAYPNLTFLTFNFEILKKDLQNFFLEIHTKWSVIIDLNNMILKKTLADQELIRNYEELEIKRTKKSTKAKNRHISYILSVSQQIQNDPFGLRNFCDKKNTLIGELDPKINLHFFFLTYMAENFLKFYGKEAVGFTIVSAGLGFELTKNAVEIIYVKNPQTFCFSVGMRNKRIPDEANIQVNPTPNFLIKRGYYFLFFIKMDTPTKQNPRLEEFLQEEPPIVTEALFNKITNAAIIQGFKNSKQEREKKKTQANSRGFFLKLHLNDLQEKTKKEEEEILESFHNANDILSAAITIIQQQDALVLCNVVDEIAFFTIKTNNSNDVVFANLTCLDAKLLISFGVNQLPEIEITLNHALRLTEDWVFFYAKFYDNQMFAKNLEILRSVNKDVQVCMLASYNFQQFIEKFHSKYDNRQTEIQLPQISKQKDLPKHTPKTSLKHVFMYLFVLFCLGGLILMFYLTKKSHVKQCKN